VVRHEGTTLRRDALRNREKLIATGRELFSEQGSKASLEELARRAGVGIGTLYRHFPTREALVEVIYEEHIGEVLRTATEAAAAEDAWAGLVGFLERVLELQAQNLPLREVFLRHPSSEGRIAEKRRRILPALERLVTRARSQGRLRPDFTVGDLLLAMWSFAPLFEATAEVAPGVWRRHLRILLDGMRAEAATQQTARPLAGRRLEAAVAELRSRYRRTGAA
jgi:AcrR family transcriptional regulator